MTKEKYYRLQLKNVLSDQQEPIALWCFDHGATGISEALGFRQNPQDYSVETIPAAATALDVFFSEPLTPEDLAEIRTHWPGVAVEWRHEEGRDWLEEWKKGFVPFELVDGIWIVPHWCERPAEARGVILMEPGMAFGTGTHETTRLAARLVAKAVREREHPRVLDVGTGTGILAILAKLLGSAETIGTDVDPEAVRVAKENLQLNREATIQVTNDGLEKFLAPFDVVVANIIDGVLVLLQKDLKRLVAPGGILILSGIIDERLGIFRERFVMDGFTEVEHQTLNEWHGFAIQRS